MSSRFDPTERRSEDLVAAIEKAAHRIATAITQGFAHMADKQAQALTDLTTAINNIGSAIAAEIAALQGALSAQGVDDSPAIETAVTNLNNLTASLKSSVAPPASTVPPTITAVSPATGPAAGNTSIIVIGTGFTGATGVTVGGATAAFLSVASDTSLTAVTPPGTAGTPVDVIVTTPVGANPAGNGAFTYV